MKASASSSPPPPASDRLNRRLQMAAWILLALVAVGLGALALHWGAAAHVRQLLQRALDWIRSAGPWAPLLFIIVYAVASVCFVPGTVLTLGSGVLFGVLWGTVYVSIGSTIGATMAFLIGRHLARDWIARKLSGHAKFQALDRATAREGWKIVGLTRFSPIFPFALLNYSLGLTRVPLLHYVLISWICMLPWTVVYVYIGSLAGAGATGTKPPNLLLRLIGLVVTIMVIVFIARIAKRELSQRISAAGGEEAPVGPANEPQV